MTPELWQQVKEVLASAMELAPDQRTAYLDRACVGNDSLRAEVEKLLLDEQKVGTQFLNETALAFTAADVLSETASPWIGRRVGPYQIVEQIGIGGMGEVYRAFRADDQYRKQVAFKVVRAGQDSRFVVTRFKNERQILADLDHPNIARLLDGGATENGAPYFVMELIEGEPVTDYCDRRRLTVDDRLKLFSQVCSAVQYAHQRLIIHRDIKPGNILVTGDGTPKLLDFGIAKILLDPLTRTSDATLTEFQVLTPRYASPEQIKGEPMTTASDVYSLGVVLYELLTGHSPYRLASSSLPEIARAACTDEPQRPSLIAQRAAPAEDKMSKSLTAEELGAARDSSPQKLSKRLTGDLDNIILMALRKEPPRRYASVEQFAEDIRRHLQNVPVAARNDTVWYRTTKFVNRHKAGVGASVVVALSLLGGLGVTLYESRIARAERARAVQRFDDVRSLANSLIFDVHDSIKDLPGSTPARKIIVDRALKYLNVLANESAGDMGLQRELAVAYERVGSVQGDYLENNLGDSQSTLTSYKKALAIRKEIDSVSHDWNDHMALAQGYRLVAHQEWATGDRHAARNEIDRAIAISEGLLKKEPNNPKVLYELAFDHGVSARVGYPDDRRANDKIAEDYRRALAADEVAMQLQPNDVRTLFGYAVDLSDMGGTLEASDPRAALINYEKALEISLKLTQISPEVRYKRSVAIDLGSIASVYDDLGDYPKVMENNMKGLAIYQDLNRADPKNALLRQGLAIAYVNTATAAIRVGRTSQALDYSNKGLEIMRGLVSSATQNAFQRGIFAAMLLAHGTILTEANRPDAAITEFENARAIYESLYKAGSSDNHAVIAACDVKMGEAVARAGRDKAAGEHFRQALSIAEPLISADASDLDALYSAADAYSGLGKLCMKRAQRPGQSVEQRKSNLSEARSWYVKSVDTWHRIEHPNHTAPGSFHVGDPVVVARELKTVEAALAAH